MSFNANTGVTTRRIPLERFELTPAHITLIYLAFGFLALYGSDVLLVNYFDDPVLSELQAVKGVVEVAVTGILIYGLTRGSRAPLEARNERLARQRGELEVLHRVLRHNLRNDINIIHGYTRLIHTHTPTKRANTRNGVCACLITWRGSLSTQNAPRKSTASPNMIPPGPDRSRRHDSRVPPGLLGSS